MPFNKSASSTLFTCNTFEFTFSSRHQSQTQSCRCLPGPHFIIVVHEGALVDGLMTLSSSDSASMASSCSSSPHVEGVDGVITGGRRCCRRRYEVIDTAT
ncbi:hypothetical protein VNO80_23232 [Phaseolus coccineus]|uniref:Uncharacterized protein n=1 Tax=Phaseolus coccineus TaxID=3886 RepID=A0AAN9MB93_PHACN